MLTNVSLHKFVSVITSIFTFINCIIFLSLLDQFQTCYRMWIVDVNYLFRYPNGYYALQVPADHCSSFNRIVSNLVNPIVNILSACQFTLSFDLLGSKVFMDEFSFPFFYFMQFPQSEQVQTLRRIEAYWCNHCDIMSQLYRCSVLEMDFLFYRISSWSCIMLFPNSVSSFSWPPFPIG